MFLPSSGRKNNYLKDVYIKCKDLDGDNVTKLDDDTKNYLVVLYKLEIYISGEVKKICSYDRYGWFPLLLFKEELTKTEQLCLDDKDYLKKYMEHIKHGQHQF